MKLNRLLLVTLLGAAPAVTVHAFTMNSGKPRAEVAFFEPEKFTDVKDSYMNSDVSRSGYLEQIRDYVLKQARYFVPEGQILQVTFTDIDLAGDFEPWRGLPWGEIRVVRDMYPPKLVLSFRLTDAEGNVLRQGKRELRDLGFMMRITMAADDDRLRHEKAMFDDWLRAEFPRVRKVSAEQKP